MKSKIMKQKETETVFSRRNYIILLIGSVVIIVGYLFMSGEGSTPAAYNPDIRYSIPPQAELIISMFSMHTSSPL